MSSPITTHVLDTSIGKPAYGVEVQIDYCLDDDSWITIGKGKTDANGRIHDLLSSNHVLKTGRYKICFETAKYFEGKKISTFYPFITIHFDIKVTQEHYHIPLLISGYGYSTYRGS